MARTAGLVIRTTLFGLIVAAGSLAQQEYGQRSFRQGQYRVQVDDREAAVYLSLYHRQSDRLFPTFKDLLAAIPEVRPTRPGARLPPCPVLVSTGMLETWAKRFDDRLVASIELLMQRGDGQNLVGKATLLERLVEELEESQAEFEASTTRAAISHILAARLLGDASPDPAHPSHASAAALAGTFLTDPRGSGKPIGLFTWTSDLEAIFRQDRFLQQQVTLDEGGQWPEAVAKILTANRPLRRQYGLTLRISAILSNPPDGSSLLDIGDADVTQVAFSPAARTLEGELFKKLHPLGPPIPPNTVVMDEFVDAIRSDRISLRPTTASGWYDWKAFALEPLVSEAARPEAQKVRWDESYAGLCEELFRAALTLRRESLVKDLSPPCGGSPAPRKTTIRVTPRISIEPQITYLRRTADSYAFLRLALLEALGPDALLATRLFSPDEPSNRPLMEQLESFETSFRCLAALACLELGASPDLAGEGLTASDIIEGAREGRALLDHQHGGSAWHGDPRVIVPVAYDLGRKHYHCWAIVGVRPVFVDLCYDSRQRPGISVTMASDNSPAPKGDYVVSTWPGTTVILPQLVWVECHASRPLTRSEFRSICDEHGTPEAIITALERL